MQVEAMASRRCSINPYIQQGNDLSARVLWPNWIVVIKSSGGGPYPYRIQLDHGLESSLHACAELLFICHILLQLNLELSKGSFTSCSAGEMYLHIGRQHETVQFPDPACFTLYERSPLQISMALAHQTSYSLLKLTQPSKELRRSSSMSSWPCVVEMEKFPRESDLAAWFVYKVSDL